jgi:pyruvate dehydrogenase E2 component (dihydrolipoamide acetyltransferase)
VTEQIIKVPDLGGAEGVSVIEILVKVGDKVAVDQALLTLEGDKATMEVPASHAGTITDLLVKIGDSISEGDAICKLSADAAAQDKPAQAEQASAPEPTLQDVVIPDIGGAEGVSVIECLIAPGDEVKLDQPLLTLEGDKATMEVPAPFAGTVKELNVNVGETVSEGDVIARMLTTGAAAPAAKTTSTPSAPAAPAPVAADLSLEDIDAGDVPDYYSLAGVYAGPAVRKLARELGVDLALVKGSGAKGRIRKQDLQNFVKMRVAGGGKSGGGLDVADAPKVDFARFGEIEEQPLTKIQKLSGAFLHRNWVQVPHVTQFADADITDMEASRQASKKQALESGVRLTPLAFIMKAVVASLQEFPKFNSSLSSDGESLVIKKYYNIGVAVDTPTGLVVAVIRDVDKKSIVDLALELGEVSQQAREKGLTPKQMQGGTFTISSLGGIGGSAFTPIVNAPEVGILGVSKSAQKPVFIDGEFKPRLMLPLCLSYDHRVVDGAVGAKFIVSLQNNLASMTCDLK